MSDFYRFPAIACIEEPSNTRQADKIYEESLEVCGAQLSYEMAERYGNPIIHKIRENYGMELMDVIHAAETALRMEFSENEVDNLKIATIVKNIKRGYYEWDDR